MNKEEINNINKQNSENEKIAMKVSFVSIILNTILSIIKFFSGIICSSSAMISDAIHSASDVFSTFIVIIGMKISNKKADKNHQYGHERIECIAALILAMILIFVGLEIGIDGIKKAINFSNNSTDIEIPGIFALIVAVISIITKEIMFWYTKIVGKKIDSPSLMADAWHHRSDALSSVGSFIGILGARLGFPITDPIASIIICIFILKAGYDILMDSSRKLIDESCDEETIKKIRAITEKQKGVLGIDKIQTRQFSSKIYIDLEIGADGNKTLEETHKIAQNVHDNIEKEIKKVKHCMIHVNPYKIKNIN